MPCPIDVQDKRLAKAATLTNLTLARLDDERPQRLPRLQPNRALALSPGNTPCYSSYEAGAASRPPRVTFDSSWNRPFTFLIVMSLITNRPVSTFKEYVTLSQSTIGLSAGDLIETMLYCVSF